MIAQLLGPVLLLAGLCLLVTGCLVYDTSARHLRYPSMRLCLTRKMVMPRANLGYRPRSPQQ